MVTFTVSIILARMLSPNDYGVVSIVTVFITMANVLVSDGFGSALIQKKDADERDFSSVLFFNIGFSVAVYGALYVAAPFISRFYGEGYEILTPVFRVLGIRIIAAGINSVQHAYVSRRMEFRKFFWVTLIGTVLSATVGIGMAYKGFGVWALVAQYLTNTLVNTLLLCFASGMKIVPVFSFARLKGLLSFGYKILFSKLLITGFQELRALIIGKLYSAQDLAFYDKAKHFPNLVVGNIDTSIGAVLFPKMSKEQSDINMVKDMTRRSIRFSSYIMSPVMLGLAAVAEPFVRILLTDKWLGCVPLMQVLCFGYIFQPIHTANLQAVKAIGKSGVFLWLEVVKKSIELVTLLVVMWFGVPAIVISLAALNVLFTYVNAFPNKRLLGYTFKEQVTDIFPPLLLAAVMMGAVMLLGSVIANMYLRMAVQIVLGAVLYVLLSLVTKNREFAYLLNILKGLLQKLRGRRA